MNDPAQLLHDYFSGQLDPADEPALRAYLWENPAHAQEFMRLALLHKSLYDYFKMTDDGLLPLENNSALPKIAAQLQHTTTPQMPPKIHRPLFRKILRPQFLAIAATLLIALFVAQWYRWLHTTVATLGRSINPIWQSAELPTGPVSRQITTLTSGSVEYLFDHNARVLVQGPATFRMLAPNKMQLYAGRITTNIPHDAAGFTVNIPSASVIDLGTEVGINVDAAGNSHIEVFTGRAAIRLQNSSASAPPDRILVAGASADILADSQKIEPSSQYHWVFTRLPDFDTLLTHPQTPASTWSAFTQKLNTDPSLLAHYFIDNASQNPTSLPNHAPAYPAQFDATLSNTTLDAARFSSQNSLHFNGSDSRALLNIPVSTNQLTIAAWVKIHTFANQFNAILASEDVTRVSACHLQVRDDSCIEFSTPHENDPHTFYHYPFFSDKVRDSLDHWSFIAVSYDADQKTISCWIDGELIDTKPLLSNPPLLIGAAQIGNWVRTEPRRAKAFDGSIDDLAIWNRTLDSAEIQAMYQAGLPEKK